MHGRRRCPALGHQGQDIVAGHQLIMLVGDLHIPGHHALAHPLRIGALAVALRYRPMIPSISSAARLVDQRALETEVERDQRSHQG